MSTMLFSGILIDQTDLTRRATERHASLTVAKQRRALRRRATRTQPSTGAGTASLANQPG